MISISPYYDLASKALTYRGIRSDMIASNIANIDTPYYKAKDIDFEGILANEAAKISQQKSKKLELATTDKFHLKGVNDGESQSRASLFLRPNHTQRNDANTVDLDVESSQMSKNAIMINAITEAMKKRGSLIKMVIDTSSRS